MTAIQTAGRTDLDALFKQSGCLDGPRSHHPFLAFTANSDGVVVHIVSSADALVAGYPSETPVMVQWPGQWSSDFFRMSVADVAAALGDQQREHSCAMCGRSTLRRGYSSRERNGEQFKVCHDCRDPYDATYPRR